MADLTVQDAIADLKKAADPGDWDAGDFCPTITLARGASIATILNAVLSGDLIPRADAEALTEVQRLREEQDAALARVEGLVTLLKKCRSPILNMAYGWPEEEALVKELDAALATVTPPADMREGRG